MSACDNILVSVDLQNPTVGKLNVVGEPVSHFVGFAEACVSSERDHDIASSAADVSGNITF